MSLSDDELLRQEMDEYEDYLDDNNLTLCDDCGVELSWDDTIWVTTIITEDSHFGTITGEKCVCPVCAANYSTHVAKD